LAEYKVRSDDFTREVLEVGDWTTMRLLEDKMIREMWANNTPCYNKGTGGSFKIDNESRAAMSLASKGRPKSNIHKENIKTANQLKAKDPEFLIKLRKPKCAGHGNKVSAALSGVPKTKEHCAALSASKLGISTGPCSELRKLAIKESTTGLPSPFKGLTYEEIMGKEKADSLKKIRSEKMKATRKNSATTICPFCNYSGSGPNMSRWHFNNCKENNK